MGTNGASWAEIGAQAIFHGLVASLFVEALVRSWRVSEPRQRMALRTVALAYPLVLFPALLAVFPFRTGEDFGETWALFAGRRWDDLRFLGVGLLRWWVAAFAAAGTALFLLDLVPLLLARRRPRPAAAVPDAESAAALAAELPPLAAAFRLPPPPVVFLDRDAPVLFCTGVRRHAIVISRGAVRLLDRQELRGALAHELAHLSRHDPAASWTLMAARALLFFNPAFQVLSRAVAKDAEWLADEEASRVCGDRLALASGLVKLHRATAGPPALRRTLPLAAALVEPLDRARSLDVEVRCRRLLDGAAAPLPFAAARVALAAASLVGLLFFVT
ncbi:MAG TPA: M56 family metallopeptidase [Anaeromyxobacter sp.]